jgi:thiaminase
MVDAKALLEGIRQDLQTVTEQLLHHPYVQALEEGKIGREKLRLFAGEQYSIIASDLKSVAYLLSRFGSAPSRDFFLGILQGERAAWDTLLTFADALGLSEAQLCEHEPLAGAHAYTCYMAWLAAKVTLSEAMVSEVSALQELRAACSALIALRMPLRSRSASTFPCPWILATTFTASSPAAAPRRRSTGSRSRSAPAVGPG